MLLCRQFLRSRLIYKGFFISGNLAIGIKDTDMEFGRAQLPIMQNKKHIKFVQSLIFLPFLTSILPVGSLANAGIPTILTGENVSIQQNEADEALRNQNALLDAQGEKIDAYFKKHDAPLEGYGRKMAEVAFENDIDYRLLPAIAMRESTGGKYACKKVKNSPFGWGSCKISFDTMDKSIETVGRNLGGNNPNTDHHYADKSVKEILQKYNPPSIVPNYAGEVMKIMKDISPEPIQD
mgnify:CR=1 FL=1